MLRALFLIAVLAAAGAPAHAQGQGRRADETAIRRLVEDYVNARDLKDQNAVGELFTADADQHTTAGEWRRGRDGIMAGTLQSSTRNPGRRRIVVQTVRFLGPDAAIVDGPYQIVAPDGAMRSMWATLVVTRGDGRWRIAAIRNAIPTQGR
jgi:uncharacterized protein (TIGR02246 family)